MSKPNAPDLDAQVTAFVKRLRELDTSKDDREKFRDFCELAYCAYAKLTADKERGEALEHRYMQVVGSYRDKADVREGMPALLGKAFAAVNTHGCDFLGRIANEIGALNAKQGQFFTPDHVSRMMAEMLLGDITILIEKKQFLTLQEPACGAGGMIIAAAEVLRDRGFDPSINMLVHAMDINPLCYQMCFLQLTFSGIPARVERMNTLSLETFEGAWTPIVPFFYRRHGRLFDHAPTKADTPPEPPIAKPGEQFTLFHALSEKA